MKNVLIWLLMKASVIFALNSMCPCRPIRTQYGMQCECPENYCDTLNLPQTKNGSQFVLITSSLSGERFSYNNGHFSTGKFSKLNIDKNTLCINQEKKHARSRIIGFGGSFTGAVIYILSQFSPKLRKYFYQSYFSMCNGIGYNMIKVPIGGTDFDFEPWTYSNQKENDKHLIHFTELDYRDIVRNTFIRDVQEYADDEIKILSAAWTPPRWMKAKHEWWGKGDNRLIPKLYQSWAEDHAKWINYMKEDGVSIRASTTGNEPSFSAEQAFDFVGMSWDPGNQAKWFIDNLVPILKQSGNADIKHIILDDARDVAIKYLKGMTEPHVNVMEYVDFISVHGYFDNITSSKILDTLYKKYNKRILYTEMSFGIGDATISPGSWELAEQLINNLMAALNHNVAAYVDWNMIVDSNGGPSYMNETINAFIVANENFTAFYKQPLYYAMAHFAKFLPPQSIRIDLTVFGPSVSHVKAVGYLRPDYRVTIVLYNNDDTNSVALTLVDPLKGTAKLILKPKSLNTFIYSSHKF